MVCHLDATAGSARRGEAGEGRGGGFMETNERSRQNAELKRYINERLYIDDHGNVKGTRSLKSGVFPSYVSYIAFPLVLKLFYFLHVPSYLQGLRSTR